ncbi:unnamed protein product [Ectocarpus sp. 12 AP-2014]
MLGTLVQQYYSSAPFTTLVQQMTVVFSINLPADRSHPAEISHPYNIRHASVHTAYVTYRTNRHWHVWIRFCMPRQRYVIAATCAAESPLNSTLTACIFILSDHRIIAYIISKNEIQRITVIPRTPVQVPKRLILFPHHLPHPNRQTNNVKQLYSRVPEESESWYRVRSFCNKVISFRIFKVPRCDLSDRWDPR